MCTITPSLDKASLWWFSWQPWLPDSSFWVLIKHQVYDN
jgi:hypothetical protein